MPGLAWIGESTPLAKWWPKLLGLNFELYKSSAFFSILQPSQPSLKERRVVFCLLGSARLCASSFAVRCFPGRGGGSRRGGRDTWPDMARFPCHFSSFCEAKAKRSGLLSEGFWQRTKTSTVCSLAQVREKFGKHMFEQTVPFWKSSWRLQSALQATYRWCGCATTLLSGRRGIPLQQICRLSTGKI